MGKYLLKRIILSIISLVVVIGIVSTLIYALLNREAIFATDSSISKKKDNEYVTYKFEKWQKYNYLNFQNIKISITNKLTEDFGPDYASTPEYTQFSKAFRDETQFVMENPELLEKVRTGISNDYDGYLLKEYTGTNQYIIDAIEQYKEEGYSIMYLPAVLSSTGKINSNAYLLAIYEKNILTRTAEYLKNLIQFETKNDVEGIPDEERYIRWEWDELSNMPALVGNGTTHKYLLYFDDIFPYVHQNFIHIDIGDSYVDYKGAKLHTVMNQKLGEQVIETKQTPVQIKEGKGETTDTSLNFHTVTYSSYISENDKGIYLDSYINAQSNYHDLSRMANSFLVGLAATFIAYLIGLPLGIWMARKKEKLVDKIGNIYIIFIMAVPSLAYIFIFAGIGMSVFGLPYKFAVAEKQILAYILPTISLALPSVGSLMKWMRRYMIDQSNSDYVKFARSQGLSEGEIFGKHIAPNAFIYLVQGIPGSILGCLTGAIITERVYGLPGVGNLLTNAISHSDNGIIIGCTFFYTLLSIVSFILGDLLLIKYDPRISFTEGGN